MMAHVAACAEDHVTMTETSYWLSGVAVVMK